QKVFGRQSLSHAGNLKTLPGDPKQESERLALGFEPDLRKFFSPVLQRGPLFRGRLFRKVHSAPPPLRTDHDGQGNHPSPGHRSLPIVTPTREGEKTGGVDGGGTAAGRS